MEFGFYIVIFILIMLKLLIWVCVIYSRAQRRRRLLAAIDAAASNPRVIIVERGSRDGQHGIHNDYSGGVDNPALAQWGLPSYDEAAHMQSKPPPYEQVVCSPTSQQQVVCSPTGQQGSSFQPTWPSGEAPLPPNYSQLFTGQQTAPGNFSQAPVHKN
ncbi:uncharacterized protein LOC127844380 [Dreissena polymorpha]|uniref:Uncharacterized protein n=1 Tax=Dreissena polymorpha TaxID=45954 RepID=A0A9D4EIK5_DREPO|nr:uncharacterized protein LOC127844380 [Dreissena polymorpha]KAH3778667.1 hypothetical protein DPMN_180137 [Dreissena polymorpha]